MPRSRRPAQAHRCRPGRRAGIARGLSDVPPRRRRPRGSAPTPADRPRRRRRRRPARARRRRRRGQGRADRPHRRTRPSATLERLDAWIAEARDTGRRRHRHRDDLARPDAGRARRHLARDRAGPGLLHAARPPRQGGTATSSAAALVRRPDLRRARRSARLKPLLEDRRPQDRPEPQVRLGSCSPLRHRRRAVSTTRC